MKTLESFVGSPLAGAIGWTLLHSLWEGALISAILAAVLLATRSARIRYVAACVAMLAVVVGFAVTLYRLIPEPIQNFPRFRAAIPFIPIANAPSQPNIGPSWLSILTAVAPWLAPFWIAGVLLLSLQRVMSFFSVRKLRTRGVCFACEHWHAELARLAAQLKIARPIHLLESCFAEIPMVLGHFRPIILMPIGLLANLPSDQVEAVLLHELAHIRRCDYLINAFQRLVESLLFYHPAIWWISKVMRNERENCCDDIVVAIGQRANEYALALAALERNRFPHHQQAAVAATGGTLVKRIRRLLYPKAPAGIWAPIAAALILVATAAVSLAAWPPSPPQSSLAGAQAQTQSAVALAPNSPYSKWLNEDVVYIITDEERDTFLHLKTDEERRQFIAAFWERRNPTPGAADNKFKDEHYRRIAYANEHFGTPSGKPGWQTDRGHIYIVYGPPDARSEMSASQNGNEFATEIWRYNHIEGVGDNLSFEFASRGGNGDFTLAPAPSSAQAATKPGASDADAALDENAKHGVTILTPTEGVDFQPYIKNMLKSVQSHWMSVMPQAATEGKASGQVSVTFRIQRDGRLAEARVSSSSGVSSFDAAAIDAIRNSSPLKPLPNEFHGPYLRLRIAFAYNRPLHI